ncbi:unnamed protein product, partial [Phaeothamnion confervicola]
RSPARATLLSARTQEKMRWRALHLKNLGIWAALFLSLQLASGDTCTDIDPLLQVCSSDPSACCVGVEERGGGLSLVNRIVGYAVNSARAESLVPPFVHDIDVDGRINVPSFAPNIHAGLNFKVKYRGATPLSKEAATPRDFRVKRVSDEALGKKPLQVGVDEENPGLWKGLLDRSREE